MNLYDCEPRRRTIPAAPSHFQLLALRSALRVLEHVNDCIIVRRQVISFSLFPFLDSRKRSAAKSARAPREKYSFGVHNWARRYARLVTDMRANDR